MQLVAPDDYDGGEAALTVFDRWLPDGALPEARALLLVAPPRLPGGTVGAGLADPVLSGLDADDPLLAGVDLDGLAIAAGAARRTTLPPQLRAIAWAPGGPLLATGARPARTTLLTFDPAASTLPQLPAFPALLANIVTAARPARRRGIAHRRRRRPPPHPRLLRRRRPAAGAAARVVAVARRARPGGTARRVVVPALEPAPGGRRMSRARIAGLLRLAAAVALVVALALSFGDDGEREPTLLLLDRSESVASDPGAVARQEAWVRAAIDEGRCGRPCRVVAFGGEARFEGVPARGAADAPDSATDLAAALRLATGALPDGGRAIVLSDGFATTGDATAAAAQAAHDGVRVDGVALAGAAAGTGDASGSRAAADDASGARGARPDAAVTRLAVPSPLRTGDALTVQATIRSTVSGRATVALTRDGAAAGSQAVTLRAGDNPLVLTYAAPAEGWHAYRLAVDLPDDAVPANDALDATTRIAPAPTALVVEGTPDAPARCRRSCSSRASRRRPPRRRASPPTRSPAPTSSCSRTCRRER